MKAIKGLIKYIRDSIEELRRVIWPTRQKALSLTGVVLSFSAVLAIYLSALDFIFRNGLEKILSK